MAVTPDVLLGAAKALGQGGAEVDQRNAASRAYYAAYHRCLPLGRYLGLSAERGRGVHRRLLDTLLGSTDPKVKSIAYMLDQCRKLQTQADYRIEGDFSFQDALLAIQQCERIMTRIDALIRRK